MANETSPVPPAQGYLAFIADKFIGTRKPVILVSYNTSGLHQWNGRWLVMADEFLQVSATLPVTIRSDKENPITDFVTQRMFVEQLKGFAEGHLNSVLDAKYHKANIPWAPLPQFTEVATSHLKELVVQLAVFSDKVPLAFLDIFAAGCGIPDLKKLIEATRKFKIDTK